MRRYSRDHPCPDNPSRTPPASKRAPACFFQWLITCNAKIRTTPPSTRCVPECWKVPLSGFPALPGARDREHGQTSTAFRQHACSAQSLRSCQGTDAPTVPLCPSPSPASPLWLAKRGQTSRRPTTPRVDLRSPNPVWYEYLTEVPRNTQGFFSVR